MSETMSEPMPVPLVTTRTRAHPACVFCSPCAPAWLNLDLHDDGAGGVQASFDCQDASTGYPGLVHGGIAAGLLDAAMTNALFARGVAALTARLSVRYHQPLRLACPAMVSARADERRGKWWIVHGEIRQEGRVTASAEAWFRDPASDGSQTGEG